MPAGQSHGARRYASAVRSGSAASTRRRIVDAAARLFDGRGYHATTMRAIAGEAGVSVQSVTLAGTKSALLLAAFEQHFAGDEGRQPLAERPAMQRIMALEPDEALGAYADFLASANAAAGGVWIALRVAAETDPEVAGVLEDMLQRRHRDMLIAVGWARSRGLVSGDTPDDERAQVLAHVAAPETFRYYTGECGWSARRYATWLATAIGRLVFQGS